MSLLKQVPQSRLLRHRAWATLAVMALLCLHGERALSQGEGNSEYRVKAAFLFNLVKFVEWPRTSFLSERSPLVIGVLGNDPFGKELDQTIANKTVNDRPLVVQRYTSLDELKACHLLFVCRSERERIDKIVARIGSDAVLTVSELTEFTKQGGVIFLTLEENKICFDASVEAARQAGLVISSKLLRLARNRVK